MKIFEMPEIEVLEMEIKDVIANVLDTDHTSWA